MGFKNVTALHCACTQPSPALLSYLLRCGFDASEGTTNSVPSSLFFALLADTPACLEFLLHHGFSLDQHGNFLSLLHLLIILHKTSSFHRFLSFFLAHGLTLNAQTASGDSYLHLAVRYHNTEAIAALIAHHINQTFSHRLPARGADRSAFSHGRDAFCVSRAARCGHPYFDNRPRRPTCRAMEAYAICGDSCGGGVSGGGDEHAAEPVGLASRGDQDELWASEWEVRNRPVFVHSAVLPSLGVLPRARAQRKRVE